VHPADTGILKVTEFNTEEWEPCSPGCKGWYHSEDPCDIEKCDSCGRFRYDEEAILAHRSECGCNHPEAFCIMCGTRMEKTHDELLLGCPACLWEMSLHREDAYMRSVPWLGRRVVFTKGIDRYPHGQIDKGETGTVISVNRHCISISLHDYHRGFEEWKNCLEIDLSNDEFDLLDHLELSMENREIDNQINNELAEAWVNGNRTFVIQELMSMPKQRAMQHTIVLCSMLERSDHLVMLKLLEG